MRRLLVGPVVCIIVLSACWDSSGPSSPVGRVSTPTAAITSTPDTSGGVPVVTTTTAASIADPDGQYRGPDFVAAGPDGVFRIVNGHPSLMVARTDVSWVADDGAGGVVFYSTPGVIERQRLGASAPETIATMASPNYVTLVEGAPTLVMSVIPGKPCPAEEGIHSVLLDLATGDQRMFLSCIPLESTGLHPRSMGGSTAVSTRAEGWPAETPASTSLVFRDLDGLELVVPGNPWPDRCPWCVLDPQLSPDGKLLALAEFAPDPEDFRTATWEEFGSLDIGEQWLRWDELRQGSRMLLRTIDLTSGATVFEGIVPFGRLAGFDGRYVLASPDPSGGQDAPGARPYIIDTSAGGELTIELGPNSPELYLDTAVLLLPARVIELRADGLGLVNFGEEMDTAVAMLVDVVGEASESDVGPWAGGATLWTVRWDDVDLAVFFVDDSDYRRDGVPHLFQWTSSGEGFATSEGVRVGSTVGELIAVYGDELSRPDFSQCGVSRNELVLVNGMAFGFALDDDPTDPNTTVQTIYAGGAPGCF